MSYVAVPWEMYHTPIPYPPEGDWDQPVPGWGQIPTRSGPPGPPRLAVGSAEHVGGPRPCFAGVGQDPPPYGVYTGPKGGPSTFPGFYVRPTPTPPQGGASSGASSDGLPWWAWVAGAAAVGIGVAVAQNKHWI